MIEFGGCYLDGKTSRSHPVTIKLSDGTIFISGEEFDSVQVLLKECRIPPALGRTTRAIILPGGARCETDEIDAVAAIEKMVGANFGMRLVNLLESHWRLVALCFAGIILSTWLFISYGIPFVAKKAAVAVPPRVTEKISRHTLKILDEHYFDPTKLDDDRIKELNKAFQGIAATRGDEFNFRLEFRRGRGMIGANAFALPSGLILMTDQLVAMSENDEELMGILCHEIAHVEQRHGMRSVFQSAGVFLIVSALTGDIASISSVASTLPLMLAQTGYSRNFEREADEGAGRYMIERGWGTKPLEDILLRISSKIEELPGISILSTHPGGKERVQNLRKLGKV